MLPKIWLSSPHMGEQEQQYVADAFATNWIAPLGPHVNAFEAELAERLGVRTTAALSSGTAALHLGLMLLGVMRDDLVLCQSFTFSGTANPIAYLGAVPVFIDSEPDSWNMDPAALEKAILHYLALGQRPKAIVPVHLYGMPARMDAILQLSQTYGIPVLEDAAEALGATYFGKPCGSLGDLGVLSFNGNKIITTSGGGALAGNDPALLENARFLATQARDPAPHYQHSTIGYNYRMSNVLAGIGRGQLAVLDNRVARRKANFERYHRFFEHWNTRGFHIKFQENLAGMDSNRWLTCILIHPENNGGLNREIIRLAMEAENIESRPLWKPMHLQPVFARQPYFGGHIASDLFEYGLCLPSGSNLSNADFDRIFSCLDKVLLKYCK